MKHLLEHKTKKGGTQYKRVFLLLCILLVVVVAIAVMTTYDEEEGYISQVHSHDLGSVPDSYL